MQRGVPIRSVSRTLMVLQIVNQSGGLTIMDMAQRSGLPYPTVRRIVRTLVHENFLECEQDSKRYRPTALVQSLSHGFKDYSGLIGTARPFLEDFTNNHMWPVSIVTRVGQMMVVRDCTHTLSPMSLTNYQAGAVFPLLECASGHVCLAYSDEEERNALLRGAKESEIRVDPLIFSQLQNGLFSETIQQKGYAATSQNRFTDTPGRTSSIGVPVFLEDKLIASLVIVYFATAMNEKVAAEKYVPALKETAKRIATSYIVT